MILDNGIEVVEVGRFESRLFLEIMRLLGIKKTRTIPLHPQSDGQVERQHRTIVNYLSKFISENQKDWDQWVPMYLFAYRSSKHESTKISPAEMHLGQDLRLPLDYYEEFRRIKQFRQTVTVVGSAKN